VTVLNRVRKELESSQRLLNAEQKSKDKSPSKGSSSKANQLSSKVNSLHQNVIDLEEMMSQLFKGFVFYCLKYLII
jgi:hypothetical protein